MNSLYLKAAFGAVSTAALFFYLRFSLRRWHAVIELSFQYHRHHLSLLQQDHTVNQRSREMATGMLWVMDKQLPRDEAEGDRLDRSSHGQAPPAGQRLAQLSATAGPCDVIWHCFGGGQTLLHRQNVSVSAAPCTSSSSGESMYCETLADNARKISGPWLS